jgi:hypothetical protein
MISAGNPMDSKTIICPQRHMLQVPQTAYQPLRKQQVPLPAYQLLHMQQASPLAYQLLHMQQASPLAYQKTHMQFHKRKPEPPQPSLSIQINLKVP